MPARTQGPPHQLRCPPRRQDPLVSGSALTLCQILKNCAGSKLPKLGLPQKQERAVLVLETPSIQTSSSAVSGIIVMINISQHEGLLFMNKGEKTGYWYGFFFWKVNRVSPSDYFYQTTTSLNNLSYQLNSIKILLLNNDYPAFINTARQNFLIDVTAELFKFQNCIVHIIASKFSKFWQGHHTIQTKVAIFLE